MAKTIQINRDLTVPAYFQLANILKQQIVDGLYQPGSRLPSESELCKSYQVSPMTVRRSINTLLDQGVVKTIKGSGTYVRIQDLGEVKFSLEEFHSVFKDRERTKIKILEALVTEADGFTAEKLSINYGEKTILMKRVLIRDGDPIIYHREQLIYDPTRPIVEAELEITSLQGLFVGGGETNLKRGELTIEAAVLTKEEADVLNTIELLPAFRLEHLFLDFEGNPFSWGRFICRGDRFRFTTTVGISNTE